MSQRLDLDHPGSSNIFSDTPYEYLHPLADHEDKNKQCENVDVAVHVEIGAYSVGDDDDVDNTDNGPSEDDVDCVVNERNASIDIDVITVPDQYDHLHSEREASVGHKIIEDTDSDSVCSTLPESDTIDDDHEVLNKIEVDNSSSEQASSVIFNRLNSAAKDGSANMRNEANAFVDIGEGAKEEAERRHIACNQHGESERILQVLHKASHLSAASHSSSSEETEKTDSSQAKTDAGGQTDSEDSRQRSINNGDLGAATLSTLHRDGAGGHGVEEGQDTDTGGRISWHQSGHNATQAQGRQSENIKSRSPISINSLSGKNAFKGNFTYILFYVELYTKTMTIEDRNILKTIEDRRQKYFNKIKMNTKHFKCFKFDL